MFLGNHVSTLTVGRLGLVAPIKLRDNAVCVCFLSLKVMSVVNAVGEASIKRLAQTLVVVYLAIASDALLAQSSACPFAVSGGTGNRLELDAPLLLRYANRGARDSALSGGIAPPSVNLASAESNIVLNFRRLDMDGDGAFTATDAAIVTRYLAGFKGDALLAGFPIHTYAIRKTGAQVEAYINGGCVANATSVFTLKDAARLLQQASFGASLSEIQRVEALGSAAAYVDEQLAKTRTSATAFTDYAQLLISQNKAGQHGCTDSVNGCLATTHSPVFYKHVMEGDDQLRQRAVNALLQIFVTSAANIRILSSGTGMANYMDMLANAVFAPPAGGKGSFHRLLTDVTLHPTMGIFLDMAGSAQEVPNENYGRELLQLFSVGTVLLNNDGTAVLNSQGRTTPTYDESVVKGFAQALTGWQMANQDYATPLHFYWPDDRWTEPMTPWTVRRCPQDGHWPQGSTTICDINDVNKSFPPPHHLGTKKLLQYPSAVGPTTLPAGQTPQQDVAGVVDNIFYHPNVAPFFVKQLIQRFVVSNPSPAYVSRIVAVFNNNGSGVRGDLKTVIRALLLDAEARDSVLASSDVTYGKMREPVVKFSQLHRAFNARPSSGYYDIPDTSDPNWLGQDALKAPSVFNYYSPVFGPAGAMSASGTPLLGPEFEITSTSTIVGFADFSGWGVIRGYGYYNKVNPSDADEPFGQHPNFLKPDNARYLTGAAALTDDPQALVDELDLLLTGNNLKADFKARLVTMVAATQRRRLTVPNLDDTRHDRLYVALWQIIHSQDYAIQR